VDSGSLSKKLKTCVSWAINRVKKKNHAFIGRVLLEYVLKNDAIDEVEFLLNRCSHPHYITNTTLLTLNRLVCVVS